MQCCAIQVEQKTHFLLTSSAHFMMIIAGIDDIFLSFSALIDRRSFAVQF